MTKDFCDSCGSEIIEIMPEGYHVRLYWAGTSSSINTISSILLCAPCNADPDKRTAIISKMWHQEVEHSKI